MCFRSFLVLELLLWCVFWCQIFSWRWCWCQQNDKYHVWEFKLRLLGSTWLQLAPLGSYCAHLCPLGSTWVHLGPLVSTWVPLVPLVSTWLHLAPPGSTWIHLGPLESTWVHLGQPGSTWVHMSSIGSTWVHTPATTADKDGKSETINHPLTHPPTGVTARRCYCQVVLFLFWPLGIPLMLETLSYIN